MRQAAVLSLALQEALLRDMAFVLVLLEKGGIRFTLDSVL